MKSIEMLVSLPWVFIAFVSVVIFFWLAIALALCKVIKIAWQDSKRDRAFKKNLGLLSPTDRENVRAFAALNNGERSAVLSLLKEQKP